MKKNTRTVRTSKPARRGVKAEVRDLKPRSRVSGGAFVRKVDKASPDIS